MSKFQKSNSGSIPFPSSSHPRETFAPELQQVNWESSFASTTRHGPRISRLRQLPGSRASEQELQTYPAIATAPTPWHKERTYEAENPLDENDDNTRSFSHQRTCSTSSVETILGHPSKVIHKPDNESAADATVVKASVTCQRTSSSTLKNVKQHRSTTSTLSFHTRGFFPGPSGPAKEVTATPFVGSGITVSRGRSQVIGESPQLRGRSPPVSRIRSARAPYAAASGSTELRPDEDCSAEYVITALSLDESNTAVTRPSKVNANPLNTSSSPSNLGLVKISKPIAPPVVGGTSGPTTLDQKKGKQNRPQFGRADLDLSITICNAPHLDLEFWDLSETALVQIPFQIHLTDQVSSKEVTQPDVTRLEIECYTKSMPNSRYSICELQSRYHLKYRSTERGNDQRSSEPGLLVQQRWKRDSQGWEKDAWVQVPVRLLAKREMRTFVIEVKVWICDKSGKDVDAEDYLVKGEAEVSVSHLKRCKEMAQRFLNVNMK